MTKFKAALTPREVAELSGAPKRLVEKAIEERIFAVRRLPPGSKKRFALRLLPPHAVAYAMLMQKLDLQLSSAHKRRLVLTLGRLKPAEMRRAKVEVAPAVEIDVGKLVGDVMERTEHYREARDAFIVSNDDIMGGTPVIRGTRLTVYSVLGRIKHGDTLDDILGDNPDLSRDAIEAAITYARTHPPMGRPGGRPWTDTA